MRQISVGRFTLGIILAALGTALLLDLNYGQDILRTVLRYWPVALILLGLEYVIASRDPENTARVSAGSIIGIAVVLCLAWTYTVAPFSFINIGGIGWSYPGQETYRVELPVSVPFGTASTRVNVEAIHDVTITGSTDSSVTGTATVTVRARTVSEAKQVAEQLTVIGRPSGSTLYIEIQHPESMSRYVSIQPSFILSVPSTGSVTSKTVSGDTVITGIRGDVDVNSVSGEVQLDGLPSSVTVNLVSGSLSMTLNSAMKNVYAKTVSGNVHITAPSGTGGNLNFSAVSGSVSSNLPGIQNSSSPGRRTATGQFGTGATNIQVNTVSGDLTIR